MKLEVDKSDVSRSRALGINPMRFLIHVYPNRRSMYCSIRELRQIEVKTFTRLVLEYYSGEKFTTTR